MVFEGDGKRVVRLADFGDASICDNEESLSKLPRSVPWEPPEHHYRGIPYKQATAMDIYSFGLLCLWVILGDYLHLSLADPRLHPCGNQSPDDRHSTVDILATVKKTRDIQEVARECVLACESLTGEQRSNLDTLFTATLAEDFNARSTDFQTLLKILGDDIDLGNQPRRARELVSGVWISYMLDKPKSFWIPNKKHWAPSVRQITTKDQWEGIHPFFNVSLVKTCRSK